MFSISSIANIIQRDIFDIEVFFFFKKKVFIFGCSGWVFIAVHRLSLVEVSRLLIAMASLVAKHRLQSMG